MREKRISDLIACCMLSRHSIVKIYIFFFYVFNAFCAGRHTPGLWKWERKVGRSQGRSWLPGQSRDEENIYKQFLLELSFTYLCHPQYMNLNSGYRMMDHREKKSRDRKRQPSVDLISCQGVKFFLPKRFSLVLSDVFLLVLLPFEF